ncbi:sulfurtransferase complex subunit TusB [Dictyoglomus thermophilum]|uniref:DsrH like protein n=2 Tax=Dictyoglomus thermophilum TaxID=14 RepID=B5YCL1_DICT6|nr:sulfurtransferase complex subunit TusB [Dictyoglomus thermophilum]ACI19923.1 DsrH like protein [Dictyoglomus thermophilum H-6-12]MCX7720134.1 sulfurtransferase complex subunit TusB [Dictyoglomus thermophilum]TYT23398.1 sulfurtransferase complex subunit TusB [Dictyoglomus thermophilum]
MALIIVKKSPTEDISRRMIDLAMEGDTILFVQDGVLHAIDENTKNLVKNGVSVFVLKEDLEARGYSESLSLFSCVDYEGWVELIEKNEKIIS